jgi:SNF2 family DNA or RNA helicase
LEIRTHCQEAFLLTGTTIHNQFDDFQTLCEFLSIPSRGTKGALPAHYYRLVKEDVGELKLPPKHLHEHFLKLDPFHQEAYTALYEGARTLYQQYLLNPELVDINCVLTKILRLRQCCNHIDSCLDETDYRNPEMRHDEMSSSKFDKILELIGELPTGEKMIVFSQWTQTLDILAQHLQKENIEYLQYHGDLSISQKNAVLNRFQKGSAQVMLMTIQSGGVGLNLTMASKCVLVDPWFNKALEEQAIDRIYRIGQTRPVEIHRFYATDTIEGWLISMKSEKEKINVSFHQTGEIYTINKAMLSQILGKYI